jgi:hypothetical protein
MRDALQRTPMASIEPPGLDTTHFQRRVYM